MSQKSNQANEIKRIESALKEAERRKDKTVQVRLHQKLLKIIPDSPLAYAKLAKLLLDSDDKSAAIPYIEKALSYEPSEAVDSLLFEKIHKLEFFTKDLDRVRAWYQQSPNLYRFKLFHEALLKTESYDEAENLILNTLESPLDTTQQAQILSLLAQIYYNTARFYDSIACSQLGLEKSPNNKQLHFNLAIALESVGRYEEAFKNYARILEQDPDHIETHNNLAYIMLRLGQFEEGWKHYEWRWAKVLKDHEQHFNIPRWSGEPLEGKTLLVWAEQGVGDHIMFASMLDDLKKMGGTIYFETYERLDPLFKRSFPDINFIRRTQEGTSHDGQQILHRQSWPKSDYHIPMGSLGSFFRPNLESFPVKNHYLYADEQRIKAFKEKYQKLFPDKKLIGISWKGGFTISNDKQSRKIPMHDLKVLANQKNVQLISLQYGDTSSDRDEAFRHGIHIFHDEEVNPLKDIDTQAAQISALDAVVSIDNTSVHIAGALGTPTYVLLQLSPNWRWGLNGGRSYWYGSVQTFRNNTIRGWESLLETIVKQMKSDSVI
ncbi:hypothetical protein EAW52_13955 [Pseudomonas sp. LTJR-52]|uniref:tetratricopeptide repeat protein n=1 Tax=Pseudomonas sp. LTJR-52 TaxID=2479392 RepID=UPI000EFD916F|nr:tetratricopeptide repeat protein [Pseudomonas sp. LTJR-52]AYN94979.1 hypothetical protein EAW52_13955 [Pseudomonas sp. LTJR-52]